MESLLQKIFSDIYLSRAAINYDSCELTSPQTPIFHYSAQNPYKVYTRSMIPTSEGGPPIEVPRVLELHWVVSASVVNRPQLIDMLHMAVGIDNLVYLYAKVMR